MPVESSKRYADNPRLQSGGQEDRRTEDRRTEARRTGGPEDGGPEDRRTEDRRTEDRGPGDRGTGCQWLLPIHLQDPDGLLQRLYHPVIRAQTDPDKVGTRGEVRDSGKSR